MIQKITLLLLLLSVTLNAQDFTDSNLPIVIIDTDIDPQTNEPSAILDDPRITATMKIISIPGDSRNYMVYESNTDFLSYNGKINIELRGSTSQNSPKKPYGLTTILNDGSNNNVSILDLPKENDWILNPFTYDPSFVRDYISYELARNMENYASRGRYCEVVLNGAYQGLYLFQEKIKVDSDRIDIKKLKPEDTGEPTITGGYVIKCDKQTGGDAVGWEDNNTWPSVNYIHDNPNPTNITSEQSAYIQSQFNSLTTTAANRNSDIKTGYPAIIDIPTFIDFMLINEFASNVDAYQYSTYLHKDKNGKLRAGPAWDFNLTYGMDVFGNRSRSAVWQFDNGDNEGSSYWKDLYNDPIFNCYFAKRWAELNASNGILSHTVINSRIDEVVDLIAEAVARNNTKWEDQLNSGQYTHIAHDKAIEDVKSFMQRRISWFNETISISGNCEFPTVPQIVISKIHYNPMDALPTEGGDLEYIEITNNSNSEIDVTGYYFRELGFTYSFPNDAILSPNQKIILASNTEAFSSYYGFEPYGEFSRGLSNKSEKLVLADAFGNIVDTVEYFDTAPWPVSADGESSFLELIDPNTDNNVAGNWKSTPQNLSRDSFQNYLEQTTKLYPNPTHSNFSISNVDLNISSYEVYDTVGRLILNNTANNSTELKVSLMNYKPNTYIVKVIFNNGNSIHKKLVVQ